MSKSWLAARIRYPALADLMGSGFHQDFWDFHESPGRGRVFARGEGADVVATAVGESILVAYDAGMQLRLATRSLRLVSRGDGRQPHWELGPEGGKRPRRRLLRRAQGGAG
ncbi:hypothetical protein ACFY2Y_03430 [Janibacter hoylei]|uniref:hypothetical protein n=1 Tax=Janibacter hoylei TaxID=364298 RepID=UPI003699C31D